jgi:NAD kinase
MSHSWGGLSATANSMQMLSPACCGVQQVAAALSLVLCVQVFVEASVHASEFPDLVPFDPAVNQVDFAITLGGDGTVL